MEYESGKRDYKKKTDFRGMIRRIKFIALILAGVALAGGVFALISAGHVDCSGLVRVKNTIAYLVLRQPPHFYYLDLEKNGKEERLTERDALTLTYRDEFVIRNIASDDLFGRTVRADVEGLSGPEGNRKVLKGVELVDRWIMTSRSPGQTDMVTDYGIEILDGDRRIARIPIRLVISPQDWLRHAKGSEDQGRQLEYLEKAVTANPKDPNVRRMLAAAYVQRGQCDKALIQDQQILAARPDDVAALSDSVKCYVTLKNYPLVVKTGEQLLKRNPRDAGAYADVAFAYGQLNRWDRAVDNYRESLRLKPDTSLLYYRLGEAYEKNQKIKEAIVQYRAFLTREPNAVYGMAALANLLAKSGQSDEAARLYRDILKREPRNAAVYANLGFAFGNKGRVAEEIESYKKAIALGLKDPAVYYNLAAAYEKGKRDAEAAQVYQKIRSLRPGDPEAGEKAANFEYKTKKYAQAISSYERIVNKSRNKSAIYANIGFAYTELKKYANAAANYERAIKYGNRDPQVTANLAYCYQKLGKTREAMSLYEQSAARHPSKDILNTLAAHYIKEKLYEKAIAAYRRMLPLSSRKAPVYANLGHVYGLKGDVDKEIETYKASLKYDAEDDLVLMNLGAAYEKKGMLQEALNAYKAAYELNPDAKKAASRYRELRIKMLQQKDRG